ncbi:MAG: AAA family ATPase [Pirellulales bacterium]
MRDTRRMRVDEASVPDRLPIRLIVTGAKGGVGATTLSVHLAAELARRGRRVVLIDAGDPGVGGGDLAAICRTEEGAEPVLGLADVLSARRTIHEVLRRGPFGLQVVAHRAAGQPRADVHTIPHSPAQAERFLEQLNTLTGHAEAILVDAGRASAGFARRLARAATCWVLVATPDDLAVMDAYAAIKTLAGASAEELLPLPKICLIVNRAADEESAAIGDRLRRTVQRFLNIAIEIHSAAVPDDPCVLDAGRTGRPLALQSPRAPAARAIERLAAVIASPRIAETSSKRKLEFSL